MVSFCQLFDCIDTLFIGAIAGYPTDMTVQDAYQSAVDAGTLTADDAQLAVLPELERVRVALATPVKRGLFRKLPPPALGLYMWGGVGRAL